MNDDFKMPFGKYKGQPLDQIPLSYLDWVIGQDWLSDHVKRTITKYLADPVIKRELEKEL